MKLTDTDFQDLAMNISSCLFDIAEEWGMRIDETNHPAFNLNGDRVITVVVDSTDMKNCKQYALLESGKIYRVTSRTYLTGGITWNGDDQYFRDQKTEFTFDGYFDEIDLQGKNYTNDDDVENIAAQLIACFQ